MGGGGGESTKGEAKARTYPPWCPKGLQCMPTESDSDQLILSPWAPIWAHTLLGRGWPVQGALKRGAGLWGRVFPCDSLTFARQVSQLWSAAAGLTGGGLTGAGVALTGPAPPAQCIPAPLQECHGG